MSSFARGVRRGVSLVRESGRGFARDRGALMAAGLAFYALLAVAPLAMVGLAVVGRVFGTEAERRRLAEELGQVMGYEPSDTITSWLLTGSYSPGIVSVVAVVIAVVMSTRFFAQIQSALNDIWGVEREHSATIRQRVGDFLARRLRSFVMVMGAGLLLLLLVVARGLTHAVNQELFEGTRWSRGTLDLIHTVLSIVVVAVIAAVTYRVLPDRDVPWRSAWWGATLSSLLFNLGIVFLGAYVGWVARTQSLGAAGAFVFLLIWLYYSAQTFILGAELSRAHARGGGS